MDELLIPLNTNISLELNYDSPIDNKNRLIRSILEYNSASETAKKLLPLILADLCGIYGVPVRAAT